MSRPPSPGHRRPSPLRRGSLSLLAALAVGLLAPGSMVVPAVRAADDPNGLLDRPLADAAFVDRGEGQAPDLLTLATDDRDFGQATLTLLRRTDTWAVQTEKTVPLSLDYDGNAPWLIQLGPGRFALVTTTNTATGVLTALTVDESKLGAIRVDDPVTTPIAVSGAGVTDVDGDGKTELVVTGTVGGYDRQCPTAGIALLDDAGGDNGGLTVRYQADLKVSGDVPVAYLQGVSLGEWNGQPGTDLLANAYECGAESNSPDRYHLYAIRLDDFSSIVDQASTDVDAGIAEPLGNPPAVIDVDRDGLNEAVVTTPVGLRVIDPSDGWRVTPFATDTSAMVGSVERSDRGLGTSLVVVRSTGDPASSGVGVDRIVRVGGRIRVDEAPVRQVPWASRESLDAAVNYLRSGAWAEQPPVMVADLDGDECPDLVAPLVLIGCAGTGVLEPAPAWIATRPMAVVGAGADRRMLVADGLDWYPSTIGPTGPSPLAARPAGTWRQVSYARFFLAEVPLAGGGSGPMIAIPGVTPPSIEGAASQDGVIDVRRPAGTRLLARISAASSTAIDQGRSLLSTPTGFLFSDSIGNEWVGAAQNLSADGIAAFRSNAPDLRMALLDNVRNENDTQADHWHVTLATLDASGTLSQPVQVDAVLDREPPALKLDVPFVSAPWPLTGTLHGTSEAGASVTLAASGPPVKVAADGTYALPVQLAPWPQDVSVLAVDEAGNRTTITQSVMGGADVRGLPWPAIGVVVVLVAVFLSSIRGVRSGSSRQPRAIAVDVNDENATVIEELSMGRIERRD